MKRVNVILLLDNSGSMISVRNETAAGLAEQLQGLNEAKDLLPINVSLAKFDNTTKPVFWDVAAGKINTKVDYAPNGGTAMRDAIGFSIEKLKTKKDDINVILTLSDGEELDSKVWSQEALNVCIRQLQNEGNYTFAFMLANQNTDEISRKYGVPPGNVKKYAATGEGTRKAMSLNAYFMKSFLYACANHGARSTDRFYQPEVDALAESANQDLLHLVGG